jgi:hypothetical protein
VPKTTKPYYNKSKRKVKAKSANNKDKDVLTKKKVNQKVDLRVVILGFAKQIDLARKAKKEFLIN